MTYIRKVVAAAALLAVCIALCACAPVPILPPAPTPRPAPTPLPDVRIAGTVYSPDAEEVDLAGRAVSRAALIVGFSALPQLRHADLTGCPLSDDDKAALMAAFPAVEFSWTVDIFSDLTLDSMDLRLDMPDRPVEDLDAFCQKLSLLPRLRYADMCGCGVDNAGMERLMTAFPHIKFVWLVRVGGFELRTDVKAFSMGQRRQVPGVRVVAPVYYHRITNADIEALQYCTDLVALDIGHSTRVSDISCLRGLTKLRYLVIAILSVEDLSPIEDMQELVYLECFNNDIADISPVAKLPKLQYLNCGMNPFTDSEPLLNMKQLNRLWINRSKLTHAQWHALEDALPNTRVKCAFDSDPSAYGWRSGNEGYLAMQKIFGLTPLGQ